MRALRIAAAGLGVAALVPLAAAAHATTPAAPTFDYRACPALTPGLDPATWRCEDHVATGTLSFGAGPAIPFTITSMNHAEGPQADGTTGQIFDGALRAAAGRVPGGLFGLPLSVRPESAGGADFLPGGVIQLKFHLAGPVLGPHCTIGSDTDPVDIALTPVPGSQVVVSQNPPVRRMDGTDDTFTVPRAHGCGPLDRLVDRRFALPAGAGSAHLAIRVTYSYKLYSELGAA